MPGSAAPAAGKELLTLPRVQCIQEGEARSCGKDRKREIEFGAGQDDSDNESNPEISSPHGGDVTPCERRNRLGPVRRPAGSISCGGSLSHDQRGSHGTETCSVAMG